MGLALDLHSYTVVAPGAAGTIMTAVSGDSLNMRNARAGTDILTLAMWTNAQGIGFTQMLTTSGHDFVRNWRYRNVALSPANKVPWSLPLHFKPQDALVLTQAGSAVGGDVETVHMLTWYEDLPGVEANLINVAELRKRAVQLLTYEDSITPAASQTYSAARAINAAADLYKADTEYAILGASFGQVSGCLATQAVDFGNLRVGIPPMPLDGNMTKDFFLVLSEMHGVPCIPVFNSANRNGIFNTIVANELLQAVPFALNLVQLAPRAGIGAGLAGNEPKA